MMKKSNKTVGMVDMVARLLDIFLMRIVDMVVRRLIIVVRKLIMVKSRLDVVVSEEVDLGVEDQPEPWRLAPQVVVAAAHCPGNTGEEMVLSGISRIF